MHGLLEMAFVSEIVLQTKIAIKATELSGIITFCSTSLSLIKFSFEIEYWLLIKFIIGLFLNFLNLNVLSVVKYFE